MEHKLVVRNTVVVVNDYEFGDCIKLENYFKIYDPNTYSYEYIGLYYDTENKILYLPRGIDIFFVEKLLGCEAYVEKNGYDKYDKYDDYLIKKKPKNDTQKEALRFTLGLEEYKATRYKSQLQINLHTGKGKTYISIASIAFQGIKAVVIASSVSWLNQWAEKTQEYCNISSREIYHISGTGCIYRLLNMSQEEIYKYKLLLVTHSTLKNYGDLKGWNKVSELFTHLRIGIKIYDEAHLNFTNICMIDFFTNVYKTYYLTATALRSDADENRIYQLSFKNVLSIDLFDKVNDPHTEYIAIKYNSKPEAQEISKCKNKYGLDRNKYTNYVVNKPNFYKMLTILMDLIDNTLSINDKCLIYIGTNESIITVYNWMINKYPNLYNNIGIYTSIISPEEKIISLTKRIILSTTKSAGAAVDISNLKITVVLAEPFKSEVIARQTLGRTRNPNTLYIDIVDVGFYYCNKYYNYKKSVFDLYATECSEIYLSDNELSNRYNRIIEATNNMISPISIIDDES